MLRFAARTPGAPSSSAPARTLFDTLPDLPLFRSFRDARPQLEQWSFAHVELLGTIGAVRHSVREGAGVAVLQRYIVLEDLGRRMVAPILPETALPQVWFRPVWLAGHPQAAVLRTLAAELAERPIPPAPPGLDLSAGSLCYRGA